MNKIRWLHSFSGAPLAFSLAMIGAAVLSASAQTDVPSDANLFAPDARGESTVLFPNLWDGVDVDGDLHVYTATAPVLNDIGQMVETPMPCYPNFVDMNDDGLKDLVVADTYGFIWIYLNSGTKGHPKFTTGTFVPTFIGWASKINVVDWDADGDNDVVIGTFFGDVVVLENTGSRRQWQFTRRMGVPRYMDPRFSSDDPKDKIPQIMLGKKPLLFGNFMAPWVTDWNRDGKLDLILGEGTYSANSVRLFLNVGSRNKPVFMPDRQFYLAFGEGYEQLVPAVTDYNGDGLPDLLVGTRTGQVRMHKGTKASGEGGGMGMSIAQPAILEFEGNLPLGGKTNGFDVMSNVYPCDWNDDGLVDLLIGSTQGKIYVAINQGSKTEPKYPSVEPVKGTDVLKDALMPRGWGSSLGRYGWWGTPLGVYCNSAFMFSAEKEVVLKPGAAPVRPVSGDYMFYLRYMNNYPGWTLNNIGLVTINSTPTVRAVTGARYITYGSVVSLKLGKSYEFSFSSILESSKSAVWHMWGDECIQEATDEAPAVYKSRGMTDNIPPSSGWALHKYTFKNPMTGPVQSNQVYSLIIRLPEGESRMLLDNFVVREVADR